MSEVPVHQLRRPRSVPELRLRLLAEEPEEDRPLDLPIRQDEPSGPMADLRLSAQGRRSAAAALTPPDVAPERRAREPLAHGDRPGGGLTPVGFDLPLFNDARDDVPLVSGNTPPRPPLAVRRAAPVTPRPRVEDVRPEPALEFAEPAPAEPGDRRHPESQPRAARRRRHRGHRVVRSAPVRRRD